MMIDLEIVQDSSVNRNRSFSHPELYYIAGKE